jgi:hypothetical protein
VALLTELQGGYTKFCCFLWEWDSQARDGHYHAEQWPLRGERILGEKNVAHRALFDKKKIYISTHHIKLALIKIIVKAINKEDEGFVNLRQ